MKNDWNGDSFDLVKRFWQQILLPIAKLYAHPRFFRRAYLEGDDRQKYESLTKITIEGSPSQPFAWLLDPDTGICDIGTPVNNKVSNTKTKANAEYTTLAFVADLFQQGQEKPQFVTVFDQSMPRVKGYTPLDYRIKKMAAFKKSEIGSHLFYFYYISHAPFLFCSDNDKTLKVVKKTILDSGIPTFRVTEIV